MLCFQRLFDRKTLHAYTCVWSPVILLTFAITVIICKDVPLSPLFKYFHNNRNELIKQVSASNFENFVKASRYFKSIKPDDSLTFHNRNFDSQADIVITIVTVKRKKKLQESEPGYLTQTAAELDRIVKSTTAYFAIKTIICNTDINGSDHTEAGYVSSFIPMVTKNAEHSEKRSQDKRRRNVRRKETMDYIYCLHQAKLMNPKYILMVEDDAIPNQNFLEVIKQSLKQIGDRRFAYLKLYYPLKWQGFAYEPMRVLELICYGAIGGYLSLFFHCNWRSRNSSQSVQFTIGMLYTIILILLIGRQNVMKFRTYSPHLHSLRPASACCTPAMLYPLETVPQLIQYLNSSKQLVSPLHIDLQIYKFTETYHIPGYQIEPNIFRHIGLVSSLSSSLKQPEEFI